MLTEEVIPPDHKAGFVNLIGKPNVGKSTLMNRLVGEKLSIITPKAQTTRHRVLGILNGENYQVVYSDTPGIIKPEYELHKNMMSSVTMALEDADLLLYLAELGQKYQPGEVKEVLEKASGKVVFVLNKTDRGTKQDVKKELAYWKTAWEFTDSIAVSALTGEKVPELFEKIIQSLPAHPPYYPKDQLTDLPERFFTAEIIREKIFLNYSKEIPYSTEVVIADFKEDETIIRIRAEIYVERQSQRGILIGQGGMALKEVGIQARKDMEIFFGKQVFLEQYVRVEKDWRKRKAALTKFGY